MMEQVQTELDMHHKFLITAQGHHSAQGEREAIQRFHDLRCDGMFCTAGIYQTMICEH